MVSARRRPIVAFSDRQPGRRCETLATGRNRDAVRPPGPAGKEQDAVYPEPVAYVRMLAAETERDLRLAASSRQARAGRTEAPTRDVANWPARAGQALAAATAVLRRRSRDRPQPA
jgi:hypothetical protein